MIITILIPDSMYTVIILGKLSVMCLCWENYVNRMCRVQESRERAYWYVAELLLVTDIFKNFEHYIARLSSDQTCSSMARS